MKELLKHFKKEDLSLTRLEEKATHILLKECMHNDQLREVMTSVRGNKPEWLIKRFFREKGEKWVKDAYDAEMIEIRKRLEELDDPSIFPDNLFE